MAMKIPFFSVMIPLYNKERYIKITLEPVLKQSFKKSRKISDRGNIIDRVIVKTLIYFPYLEFVRTGLHIKALFLTYTKKIK